MPYYEKYGISPKNTEFSPFYTGYQSAAGAFDTRRDTEAYKSNIKQRFLSIYGALVRSSLKQNGTVDPKEILKDAQEMIDIELKHCTVVYDHPEAKPIADENVYGFLPVSILQKRVNDAIVTYNKTAENKISDEDKQRFTNMVETIVNSDREENQKRLEEIAEKEKPAEII